MITTGDIQMSHGHAHISCPTVGHIWLECYLGTNAALHTTLMVQALITLRRGLGASFCYDLCFNCTSHAVDKHILVKPVDEHMRRVDKNTQVCLKIRYPQINQFIIMSFFLDLFRRQKLWGCYLQAPVGHWPSELQSLVWRWPAWAKGTSRPATVGTLAERGSSK